MLHGLHFGGFLMLRAIGLLAGEGRLSWATSLISIWEIWVAPTSDGEVKNVSRHGTYQLGGGAQSLSSIEAWCFIPRIETILPCPFPLSHRLHPSTITEGVPVNCLVLPLPKQVLQPL